MIRYEYKKILHTRVFLIWLIVLSCLPLLIFGISLYTRYMGDVYSYRDYRELTANIGDGRAEDEYEALNDASEALLLRGFSEKMYTDSIVQEYMLYQDVMKELNQIIQYPAYIENVTKTSRKKSLVSIFSKGEENTEDILHTIADFEKMKDVEVRFCAAHGVNLFMKFDAADWCLIVLCFFLIAMLVSSEIDECRFSLLRSTLQGKSKIVYAKYICGLQIELTSLIFIYAVRLILIAGSYGFGDDKAALQCVEGFIECTLRLTIGEGLVLFIFGKILVFLALYSFLFAAALFWQDSRLFYLAGVIILMSEYIAYEQIPASSYLYLLKWINPIAFIHMENVLGRYKNIVLFGKAVPYNILVCIICLFTIALCILIYGKLYRRITAKKKTILSGRAFYLMESMGKRLLGNGSFYGYEIRKWFFYQKGALLLVFLGCCVFLINKPVSETVYTTEQIYYRQYVREVEGSYSDDKLDYLYSEKGRLQNIQQRMQHQTKRYADSVKDYFQKQMAKEGGLMEVIQYGRYLSGKPDAVFLYGQGYENLFGMEEGEKYLFWFRSFSVMAMAFLSTLIWGLEESTKMKQIINCTYAGMKEVNRHKCRNVLLAGLVIFAVVYIPWIRNVFSVFGRFGINSPAYSLMFLEHIPSWCSIGFVLAGYYFLHLLCLWIIGFITRKIFFKCQNMLITLVFVFCLGMILMGILSILIR